MTSISRLILFLPLIFASCSSYQKVTLTNFKKYEISFNERKDLQYVLKKHKLHYSEPDRKFIINNHNANESEAYESHNIQIDDHIVIPKGALGVCINSNDDYFVIDFGKGIFVPFIISNENNRARAKIVAGERAYDLEASRRNAMLYFNHRAL
jgi:hypothetical protein